MSSPIILITGANTGLGFEIVKALSQSEATYTILVGGRSIDKAKAAVVEAEKLKASPSTQLQAIQIDIEDDASISSLYSDIEQQHGRLDILINNAGAQFDQQVPEGKINMRDMWNKSWSINTTSTFMLTHTLIPLLLKSADPRILFITSGTSTLTDHDNTALAINQMPEAGWPKKTLFIPAYRASKTGLNMMMREWVRILGNDGVKIWCVSPGFLATGLGFGKEKLKAMGAQDPEVGGMFVRDVVEGKRDQDVGKVVVRDGVQPW